MEAPRDSMTDSFPAGCRFDLGGPGQILFGSGRISEAVPLCCELGSNILIVTGSSTRYAKSIEEALRTQGANTAVFSSSSEPTLQDVEGGLAAAKSVHATVVLAIGGGAAIDLGKAVAAMLPQPGALLDYLEVIGSGRPLHAPSAPFIAIPTTAGTGAEATKNAVLTSVAHRVKVSLRHPTMFPKIAIIDPALMLSLPRDITASSGVDALTQLMEAYVSTKAQPMTDILCAAAIPIAAKALPDACANGADIKSREEMAFAALNSGIALANAGLGAVHGFAAPIGGLYQAAHGAVCAALLAPVWSMNLRIITRANASAQLQRFTEVARWLTADSKATAYDAIPWLHHLSKSLNIRSLAALGVTQSDLPGIADAAAKASSMKGNPVILSEAQRLQILEEAL